MDDYRIVKREPGNVLTILIRKPQNQSDLQTILAKLPDDAAPGSSLFTADMTYMANKDIDGTWAKIGG